MSTNVLFFLIISRLLAVSTWPVPAAAVSASSSMCPDLSPAANNASSITIATPVVIRAPCTFTNVRLNIDVLGAQSSTAAPTTAITIDGAAFYHDPAHADGACVSATGVAGITKPVLLTVRNSYFEMMPGAVATTKVLDFVAISSFSAGMLPAGSAITIQNNTFRAAWIALSGSGALLVGALLLRGDLVLVSSNVIFLNNSLEMEYITGRGAELYGVRAIDGVGPTTNLHALNRSVILLAGNSIACRHVAVSNASVDFRVSLFRMAGVLGPPSRRINVTITNLGSSLVVSQNAITLSNLTLDGSAYVAFAALDPLSGLLVSDSASVALYKNLLTVNSTQLSFLKASVFSFANGLFNMSAKATLVVDANALTVPIGAYCNITTLALAVVSVEVSITTNRVTVDAAVVVLSRNTVTIMDSLISSSLAGVFSVVASTVTATETVLIKQSAVHVSDNTIAVANISQTVTPVATEYNYFFLVRLPGSLANASLVVDAFNRIAISNFDAHSRFTQHLYVYVVDLGYSKIIAGSTVRAEGGGIVVNKDTRIHKLIIAAARIHAGQFAGGAVLLVRSMDIRLTESTISFCEINFFFGEISILLYTPSLIAVRENCVSVRDMTVVPALAAVVPIRAVIMNFFCGWACTEVVAGGGCSATATLTLVAESRTVTTRDNHHTGSLSLSETGDASASVSFVPSLSLPPSPTPTTGIHLPTKTDLDASRSLAVGRRPSSRASMEYTRSLVSHVATSSARPASDMSHHTHTRSHSALAAGTPSALPHASSTSNHPHTPSHSGSRKTIPSTSHTVFVGPRLVEKPAADPMMGPVVATGVIGTLTTPVNSDSLSSVQLLAIFAVMSCQMTGTPDATVVRRFLTPVGLDGRSGALAGNVLVAAGLTVLYGAVFAVIACVLRSRERARRLLRHPQALPLLHLVTLPGLAFEAATLLYGDAAATAGERVFGGAVLALCCASAGAYGGVSAYYHARVAPLEATVVLPRWGPAELAARVPRAVRALLVPAAGWAEAVRADPRCVYAGLRPLAPAAAHHAVAGHSALRVLLVCVVCAVRPGAEWHCTAVLVVAGVVCAAHAALLLALRPLRIPVSNPLQAAQSAACCGVLLVRAGNGPAEVSAAFTILLVVASLFSSVASVGGILVERRYKLFTDADWGFGLPSSMDSRPASGSCKIHVVSRDSHGGVEEFGGDGVPEEMMSYSVECPLLRRPPTLRSARKSVTSNTEESVSPRLMSPAESAIAIALSGLFPGN